MAKQRINFSDINLGHPLPWDVFDSGGRLLLSKGYLPEDERQLESLIERGVFFEAENRKQHDEVEIKREEPPSALRAINLATERLRRTLAGAANETDFCSAIMEIAKQLYLAAQINPNVVAASVLFNGHAEYPIRHSINTASIALLVAQALNLDESGILSLLAASLTMDIAVIGKDQSAVKNRMRRHPEIGVKMLEQLGVGDGKWLECVLAHHESEDGTGYPYGLKSTAIPQSAKIVSVSDGYCSRVGHDRTGRAAIPSMALREMFIGQGKCASLAPIFMKALGLYPPGTFVRLMNGEIGVVSGAGESVTTPYVHALIGPRGAPLAYAIKRNTSKSAYAIREAVTRETADIRISMQQVWAEDASL